MCAYASPSKKAEDSWNRLLHACTGVPAIQRVHCTPFPSVDLPLLTRCAILAALPRSDVMGRRRFLARRFRLYGLVLSYRSVSHVSGSSCSPALLVVLCESSNQRCSSQTRKGPALPTDGGKKDRAVWYPLCERADHLKGRWSGLTPPMKATHPP
jgi:hypothetical protein